MKKNIIYIKNMKQNKKKITMLTAYDYSMASIIDSCDVDSILVGDSLGMVALGYNDTLSVTMEDMLHHVKAVRRGTNKALLVADMPFMSYHSSKRDALKNAGRLIQEGGAEAVKIEGADFIEEIRAIIKAQIPVMGHIGLTPQSVNLFGGYKIQGKEFATAQKLLEDAKCLEDAGVFAVVLECIPAKLARLISKEISIPTIGIGAGAGCDGQILVPQDMLNINAGGKKKFVNIFEDCGESITIGIKAYIESVRNGSFPGEENTFEIDEEILNKIYGD
jgi:3-methyl-2-oxobutanoate hydroxymethyltransferase